MFRLKEKSISIILRAYKVSSPQKKEKGAFVTKLTRCSTSTSPNWSFAPKPRIAFTLYS